MNRRAIAVLVATFAAALAVMLWLVAEMRTAARGAGPPPSAATASPAPPEPPASPASPASPR